MNLDMHSPENHKAEVIVLSDAGVRARERLQGRSKVAKAWFWTKLVFWSTVLLLVTAVGAYAYWVVTHAKTGYVQDQRTCTVQVGKQTVTGIRTFGYSYKDYSFPGFSSTQRLIDKNAINEQTKLDIRGDAITIVGSDGVTWWSIPVGMGEKGVQVLKPATSYTFFMNGGKDVGVIEYGAFCR